MSIESVMLSNHFILCHPLCLLPSIFPSIRVFSNELALRSRWQMYWSFNFTTSPSNEYSGLISFRMDWLDLLAVLGTLRVSSLRAGLGSQGQCGVSSAPCRWSCGESIVSPSWGDQVPGGSVSSCFRLTATTCIHPVYCQIFASAIISFQKGFYKRERVRYNLRGTGKTKTAGRKP